MTTTPSTPAIIDVQDLVVVYPDGTRAVDGISFQVPRGAFFGFLGPNGAGKSTTIKTLTTLLQKASGKVQIDGKDLDRSPQEIRKVIGVLAQETVVDVDLTGRENLRLFGRLQQLRGEALERRVEDLIRVVQLEEAADKPAGRYSGGMRKRLDLASALVHRPKLLFLDEPTTGLDPQSRAAIWEYLERLNEEDGITIFLTTQYMEEADRLCKSLSIIDHGKLIASGRPSELKAALGGDTLSVVLGSQADEALRSRAQHALEAISGLSQLEESPGGLQGRAKDASHLLTDVVLAMSREGVRPTSLTVRSPTLDDVFLKLTGRKIRAEELGQKTEEPFLS